MAIRLESVNKRPKLDSSFLSVKEDDKSFNLDQRVSSCFTKIDNSSINNLKSIIQVTHENPVETKRTSQLKVIADAIFDKVYDLKWEDIDLAYQIALLSPVEKRREATLQGIGLCWLNTHHNPEETLKIAHLLNNRQYKEELFQEVANSYLKVEDIHARMLEDMIDAITVEDIDAPTVEDIDAPTVEDIDAPTVEDIDAPTVEDIDAAIKLAELITLHNIKDEIYCEIVRALIKVGDSDRMIECAERIVNKKSKDWALQRMVPFFIEKGDLEKAQKLAEGIIDEKFKGYALQQIVKAVANNGDIDRAEIIAWLIPAKLQRSRAFQHIILSLINKENIEKNGNIDRAIRIVQLPDVEIQLKKYLLEDMHKAVTERRDVDSTTKINQLMSDISKEGCTSPAISKPKLKEVWEGLSGLVTYFGYKEVEKIVEQLKPDNMLYSVGSGNGALEAYLQGRQFRITCIDPDPYTYRPNTSIFLYPKYDYLANALFFAEKGNATLCLIAPPTIHQDNWVKHGDMTPEHLDWDMKAVNAHTWDQILLIIDTSRSAGGPDLLRWIRNKAWSEEYEVRYTHRPRRQHGGHDTRCWVLDRISHSPP